MAENTKIGWATHTQNFWIGCHKVSEECRHCYIDGIIRRSGREPFNGPMRTKDWSKPWRWEHAASKAELVATRTHRDYERPRIFTCSMSDFFHSGADEWRSDAWELIRQCEHLDWLILTKRPELAMQRMPDDWGEGWGNVWLGVTAGCRSSLHRLDTLREIPAAIKFVSCEPLLEDLGDLSPYLAGLDWVITGCEQAAKYKRRPMDLDWVRSIDKQCMTAGVAHFFKQRYIDDSGLPVTDGILDGVVRQAFPEATHA